MVADITGSVIVIQLDIWEFVLKYALSILSGSNFFSRCKTFGSF